MEGGRHAKSSLRVYFGFTRNPCLGVFGKTVVMHAYSIYLTNPPPPQFFSKLHFIIQGHSQRGQTASPWTLKSGRVKMGKGEEEAETGKERRNVTGRREKGRKRKGKREKTRNGKKGKNILF